MKYFATAAALWSLASAAIAGPIDTKSVSQPAPANYGTGLYLGPEGGFNAYSNSQSDGMKGITDKHSHLGGFAGGKLGYVFDTGIVRPAIEADLFYNGFGGSWDRVFTNATKHDGHHDYHVNSGAFMENELVRFNLGAFQPYAGAGIGCYTEGERRKSTDRNYYTGHEYSSTSSESDRTSWAWQVVAGADYYIKPKLSVFVEYKFLNYMDMQPHGRLGQQLAGAGIRLHF